MIRPATTADHAAIDAVVSAAFGQRDEVDLVHQIRGGPGFVPELELVAEEAEEPEDDGIVGHVMLSYADLGTRRVLQLAPLAVAPSRQRAGIGGALTGEALRLADERGEPLVLVLGHPTYYPRFGFEPSRPLGIRSDIPDLPDDVFMVRKLRAYDATLTGVASFPAG